MLKVKDPITPKRRINFSKWMIKHKVSTEVISSVFGVTEAIESMHR